MEIENYQTHPVLADHETERKLGQPVITHARVADEELRALEEGLRSSRPEVTREALRFLGDNGLVRAERRRDGIHHVTSLDLRAVGVFTEPSAPRGHDPKTTTQLTTAQLATAKTMPEQQVIYLHDLIRNLHFLASFPCLRALNLAGLCLRDEQLTVLRRIPNLELLIDPAGNVYKGRKAVREFLGSLPEDQADLPEMPRKIAAERSRVMVAIFSILALTAALTSAEFIASAIRLGRIPNGDEMAEGAMEDGRRLGIATGQLAEEAGRKLREVLADPALAKPPSSAPASAARPATVAPLPAGNPSSVVKSPQPADPNVGEANFLLRDKEE